jgi:hypothetical protein
VAVTIRENPCTCCEQPGNDLIDGRIEYQHIHLQQYRECCDVEGHYGKENEERIRQELVHGWQFFMCDRKWQAGSSSCRPCAKPVRRQAGWRASHLPENSPPCGGVELSGGQVKVTCFPAKARACSSGCLRPTLQRRYLQIRKSFQAHDRTQNRPATTRPLQ